MVQVLWNEGGLWKAKSQKDEQSQKKTNQDDEQKKAGREHGLCENKQQIKSGEAPPRL